MTWGVLAVVLVVIGFLLIFLEALVPSGGVLTVLALLSGGAGVVIAFVKFEGPLFGIALLVGVAVVGPAMFLFGLSRLPHTRFGKRLVLTDGALRGWAPEEKEADTSALVGLEGRALSDLRPAGLAEIAGRRYDVVTEGTWAAAGTRVKVLSVEANVVLVRPVEEPGPDRSA